MRPYAPILATLTAVTVAVGFAPVAARTAAVPHGTTQGGILGRYVLRSVDGVNLPAPIPGEDPRHKLRVMDGVLVLNSDGTYVCQTIVQTSFMGMVETSLGAATIVRLGVPSARRSSTATPPAP